MTQLVDYDTNGYPETDDWERRYAMRRLLRRLGRRPQCCAAFGGGGRAVPYLLRRARIGVLVDYSPVALRAVAERYRAEVAAGRLYLVRADLTAPPFRDLAFDAALTLDALHRLGDLRTNPLDEALAALGRTVRGRWLIEVPVKNHLAARLQATRDGDRERLADAEPILVGDEQPVWRYRLDQVRDTLRRTGWRSTVAASLHNLAPSGDRAPGRWRPVVEAVGQRVGRGWCGSSQLLLARRLVPIAPPAQPAGDRPELGEVAGRMACPGCSQPLVWAGTEAYCTGCAVGFRNHDGYWDFVTGHTGPAPDPRRVLATPPPAGSSPQPRRYAEGTRTTRPT